MLLATERVAFVRPQQRRSQGAACSGDQQSQERFLFADGAWEDARRGCAARICALACSQAGCRTAPVEPAVNPSVQLTKHPETCRMFENELFERFSRIHPATVFVV